METRSKIVGAVLAAVCVLGMAPRAADAGYVAATWNDNRVHILDNGLNALSSFPVGQEWPNGIATDGGTIWVGTFVDATVRAFDFAGVLQYSWLATNGIQGMELVGDELGIFDAGAVRVNFYNPTTGAFSRSIPGTSGSIEGITYDGTLLWAIEGQFIRGLDPLDGSLDASIPNAANGCGFGGTGIASIGGGRLTLGCSGGAWFTVSSADGSVITSGNNGLDMFGLKYYEGEPVPEPGLLALVGLGLGALGARRRR